MVSDNEEEQKIWHLRSDRTGQGQTRHRSSWRETEDFILLQPSLRSAHTAALQYSNISSSTAHIDTVQTNCNNTMTTSISSTEFFVTVRNTGGGNAGVARGELICLQSEFCSYVPLFYVDNDKFPISEFADYNEATQATGSLPYDQNTLAVLADGSARYGQPVCGESNCEAVVVYDNYLLQKPAVCPIGTEMVLSLTGETGDWDRCATPPAGVQLSGELPDDCQLITGGYCCPAGGVYTLKFVHNTAPCQPSTPDGLGCPFPQTGRAYGQCGANQLCVRNLQADQVGADRVNVTASDECPPVDWTELINIEELAQELALVLAEKLVPLLAPKIADALLPNLTQIMIETVEEASLLPSAAGRRRCSSDSSFSTCLMTCLLTSFLLAKAWLW
mmetsp:Transcript_60372/g.148139  ORF Transcript_60372/g.148139 Transcript_60372/m.148139 type:complete len:390 (-) Transcript_60372:2944-4113(-)